MSQRNDLVPVAPDEGAVKLTTGAQAGPGNLAARSERLSAPSTACDDTWLLSAVELVATALSVHHGAVHPTRNHENPDPDCDLDYVPNAARDARCDVALSNSFGFGGQNITLIAGRFQA